MAEDELAVLHARIDACRICELEVGSGYRKIEGLDRGKVSRIMIVGQGPGNNESANRRAFAGPAGTILDRWLVACGAPADDPRRGVYLTSLIKCVAPGSGLAYRRMVRNCRPLLMQQLSLLRPALVITLGLPAYTWFEEERRAFADALCTLFESSTDPLRSRHPHPYVVMPWPHPSPANNKVLTHPDMAGRLARSFDALRPYFQAEAHTADTPPTAHPKTEAL